MNHDAGQDGTTENGEAEKAAVVAVGLTGAVKGALKAEEGEAILHFYRNLRCFSRYLMKLLQKGIIFPDFCSQSVGMAYIHAVLQEFR
ncbi:hypothetical protein DOE73_27285 [Paenibacillus dendritiformis]|nr:hypothetical protein DOE73_27285 [Paenibacillus dendritiformis]